jgi:hypothetical protein
MTVAGLVIETLPGRADAVSARLSSVPRLAIHGQRGNRLAATWSAPDGQTLQQLAEELMNSDDEIVGIFPTQISL